MPVQHAVTFWEALWPDMGPVEVTRVRVTAKEFNDAEKYGPRAELYLLFTTKHESRDRTS